MNRQIDYDSLIKLAVVAKENAYAPYSGFRVGAALITGDGKVYTGVNIENASFGATNCAERTAVFKAVSEGSRRVMAIAIASDSEHIVFPCGICRQVLVEFGDDDMEVICTNNNSEYKIYKIYELLPEAFKEIK